MNDSPADDSLAEVKEAAGAVLVSLRWLLDAAERALADPEAVDSVVDAGRGIAQAFTEGFLSDPGDVAAGSTTPPPAEPADGA